MHRTMIVLLIVALAFSELRSASAEGEVQLGKRFEAKLVGPGFGKKDLRATVGSDRVPGGPYGANRRIRGIASAPEPSYMAALTVKLDENQTIIIEAGVVGEGRKIMVVLTDPTGVALAASTLTTQRSELKFEGVSVAGDFKIFVISNQVGSFNFKITDPDAEEVAVVEKVPAVAKKTETAREVEEVKRVEGDSSATKSNQKVVASNDKSARGLSSPKRAISTAPKLLLAPFNETEARVGQAAWAKHLNENRAFTNQSGVEMVLIPPGEYLRGSSDADVAFALNADSRFKAEIFKDEQPQHRVRISKPFYMAKFETTQEQFEKLMGYNPAWFSASGGGKSKVSGLNTSQFPIEQVSWYDCLEFCNKLSEAEGKSPCYDLSDVERNADQSFTEVRTLDGTGYRLPTEAEWEYACRAGTTTAFHFGNQLNGTQANVNGNFPFGTATKGAYLERTSKVGTYSANNFGLYDMCGNVWEWCHDGYNESAYGKFSNQVALDPIEYTNNQTGVLRGGSWYYSPWNPRSALRYGNTTLNRPSNFGLRVVSACGPRT